MTDLLSDLETPSDAELISGVRGGDVAAYGDLFSRHVDAANRLARQLVRGPDSDDLVSEAFAKVLQVLQGGGGPDVAFRAYLLTAVRRLHIDRMRAGAKVQTSDDMEDFDPGIPFQDTAVAQFESGAAARAFATLPERWQLVLWHLEVEGQKPAEIATLLGMSANSVSALAYRAREGLRQAFLTMHLNDITETDCRWVNEHLGAYVRKGLSKRDSTKVQHHVDECRRCTAMYLELTEVNSNLRGIIAPVLLGAAAAGYLSSTGAAGGLGLTAVLGRTRDVVLANAGTATAGAVAAGVAAVATAGIVLLPSSGTPERIMSADNPVVRTSPELSFPPSSSPGAETSAPSAPSGIATSLEATSAPDPTPAAGATEPAVLPDGGTGTTTGPAALPGEPGALPAPLPGADNPGPAPAGPGTDPGPGPGTDPGTDPGTGPGTNPEPPAPGPTGGPNPGPGPGPAPDPDPIGSPDPDPVTNPDPGPITNPDPGPITDPAPGDTGGDGGGGDGGTDLLVSTLSVPSDQVTVSADSIAFPVQGEPHLPATLLVSMGSQPDGFGFGEGVNCQPTDDLTKAECDTTPGGGGSALARVTAVGGNNAFVVNLPLVPPDGVDAATLHIKVSVPDGYDTAGNVELEPLNWTAPKTDPQPASADLRLSGLPDDATPNEAGTYSVSGTVSGIPLNVDAADLAFTAGPELTDFAPTVGACSVVGSTKNCTVTFTMKDAGGALPTAVTIAVQSLPDYVGDDPVDNSATVTLLGAPIDAALQSTAAINGESGSGTVTVTVSGLGEATGLLNLDYDSSVLGVTGWPLGCPAAPCRVGDGTYTFEVAVQKAGNAAVNSPITFQLSVPNHHDTNPTNDSTPEVVTRDPGSGNEADRVTNVEVAARLKGEPS